MEIQNINTLLKNKETRELGAMMAVSQGLERKFLAFYEAKRNRKRGLKVFFKLRKDQPSIVTKKAIMRESQRYAKACFFSECTNILVCVRDAMHDKEVEELVQAGKMKESERLPF